MKRTMKKSPHSGFTIIELMVALGIFLVIVGAAFTLLGTSQQRYQSDSQVLNSFQEARLGMDQIVRDVNDSGFPPPSSFSSVNSTNANLFASTPFAWSAGSGYPSSPCSVGGSCSNPGDPGNFDLIVETSLTPSSPVSWVRYQLVNTTLYRGVAQKVPGDDPAFDTSSQMTPYVQNVMNNASASQIAQFQALYPGIFGAGTAVPIFSYFCDISADSTKGQQPCSSSSNNLPQNIRSVAITLIVMASLPDAQTGQPRLVELSGLGRRINPNQ
jgi:prepilin-type N-terminal cleavage/methylation domain-containing protein